MKTAKSLAVKAHSINHRSIRSVRLRRIVPRCCPGCSTVLRTSHQASYIIPLISPLYMLFLTILTKSEP